MPERAAVILDYLSGYPVHNTGHNHHPAVVEALREELERNGPAMLQSRVPELAAEPAQRLAQRGGGRQSRALFAMSLFRDHGIPAQICGNNLLPERRSGNGTACGSHPMA